MGDVARVAALADRRGRAQHRCLAGDERLVAPAAPESDLLIRAARTALAAQQEIARTKEKLGLMQPAAVDPNRTGLIGPDWSETTTTIGDLPAKRTVTNPDLAAAIARILLSLDPPRGAAVGLVLSGSFVGANVAAIAAVEAARAAAGHRQLARRVDVRRNDPAFTWLDMESDGPQRRHLAGAICRPSCSAAKAPQPAA